MKGFLLGSAVPATVLLLAAASPALAKEATSAVRGNNLTNDTGESGAGDIIVTARRVEERLQDVPISISVFSQQQLANANVVSASDLAATSPSLSANNNYGSQNSSFAIRGFVQDNGTAPAVGVYFADVVSPRAASNGLPAGDGAGPGSFFDLQNVQVLNGPQGTLFGRNTTGGAVLLVPQKPTDKLEGFVEGSVGNYNMWRGQGVINLPLSDTFRVRFGVDRMKRSGYLQNTSGVGPKDFNDVNYTAFRLSVVGDLTPDLENYTIASYSRSNTHGDFQKLIGADAGFSLGGFAVGQLSPGQPNYQGSGFYDAAQSLDTAQSLLTTWQVINTTTWQASDTLTVKNIISYAQLKDFYNNPIFGSNFRSPAVAAIGLPSYPLAFAWASVLPGGNTANESTFTEEFRLSGHTGDDRLNWQAGAYLESVRPLSEVGSDSPTLLSCAGAAHIANNTCYDILGFLGALGGGTTPAGLLGLTKGETSFRNVGLYAQATYKVSDEFKITAGARYTWDRENLYSVQETTFQSFPPNLLGLNGPSSLPFTPITICSYPGVQSIDAASPNYCRRDASASFHKPTWLIDFDYTPSPDMLIYAKYARGYRTGGLSPNVTAPFDTFAPEKVDAFEVGAKNSFRGNVSGTFNVAGFYNNFSNQQLQLGLNPNPCFSGSGLSCQAAPVPFTAAPINAGKSRIWGAEVSSTLNLFTGFTLSVGYTYLNTKITRIASFAPTPGSLYLISGSGFRVGDPLELSPRNKVTVTGTYRLPLDSSVGRIALSATYTHTDQMFVNPNDRAYVGTAASSPAAVAMLQSLSWVQATNLVNVNVNWDSVFDKPLDLAFFVTNLTNQHYYSYIPGLASAVGFETAQVGPPRMFGFRAKVHF
jgi:iron complex outermembrane receptor protein